VSTAIVTASVSVRRRGILPPELAAERCLDWLLILNRRHLERVLRVYIDDYNTQRPHRGVGLRRPIRPTTPQRPWVKSVATTSSAD
jgi:hypothetical protein